jgi:kynurenine formamidase
MEEILVKPLVTQTALLTVMLVIALGAMSRMDPSSSIAQRPDHNVSKETIDRWMTELSNWGRWGKDDEKGTLNLLTPDRRRRALSTAREGTSVSLSHNYIEESAEDTSSPFVRQMVNINRPGPFVQFVGDRYTVQYHGGSHTHLDALCHDSYLGKIYNGFPGSTITQQAGCTKNGITNLKQGIVAHGLLIDIARLKGVPYLEPGTPIFIEDIEAWERQAKIKVAAGDFLVLRTGRWSRRAAKGAWATDTSTAGLHASVIPWLKERDVAFLGSDSASDVLPSGVDGVIQPIHQFTLVALGMPLFDNLDLEAVAEEAAKRARWEFLIIASPLAVNNGTGSPLNPLAIF